MWTMKDVGTDRRCDHKTGCPLRTLDCEDIYGTFGGDSCTVVCANDRAGK